MPNSRSLSSLTLRGVATLAKMWLELFKVYIYGFSKGSYLDIRGWRRLFFGKAINH
jgi:hypothetical protein